MKNNVEKLLSYESRERFYFLLIAALFEVRRSVIGAELSVQL